MTRKVTTVSHKVHVTVRVPNSDPKRLFGDNLCMISGLEVLRDAFPMTRDQFIRKFGSIPVIIEFDYVDSNVRNLLRDLAPLIPLNERREMDLYNFMLSYGSAGFTNFEEFLSEASRMTLMEFHTVTHKVFELDRGSASSVNYYYTKKAFADRKIRDAAFTAFRRANLLRWLMEGTKHFR